MSRDFRRISHAALVVACLGGTIGALRASAVTTSAVATRVYLADGRVLDGILLGGGSDSLTFRGQGEPQELALATVRLLSFVAKEDLARERERLDGAAQALVLRSGAVVRGRLLGMSADAISWQTEDGSQSARYPLGTVRRVWVDASAFDFPPASGSAAGFQVSSRTAEGIGNVTALAAALRLRLLGTAHHGEPFEQQAIAALGELESRAAELGRVLAVARPDADSAFRATELLLAQVRDVDRAMDALHAYESVRADWAQTRDFLVPDVAEGMKRAFQGAR